MITSDAVKSGMSTTIPAAPPAVRMRWDNLLFLHWPVPAEVIRPLVPEPLEVDLYNGTAWVALVPFRMEATRFRGYPPFPGLGSFYECNVRTYVRMPETDKRNAGDVLPRERLPGVPGAGVWFMSLDAERLLPVLGGRWLWKLNYVHSRFEVSRSADERETDYRLARRATPSVGSRIVWRRGEPIEPSKPGSIEHFLTERYWLYTVKGGRLMAGRIAHEAWPLRSAELLHLEDGLVQAGGVEVGGDPLAWHSDTLDVIGWKLVEAHP